MNKTDLISRVCVDAGVSKREASTVVDAVLGAIQRAVARGEKVTLPGFGTFIARPRPARTARNPQTGAAVKVKATTVPVFRPGQGFRDAVAGAKKMPAARATAQARGRATARRPGPR